jgi:hypothetical protein
VKSPNVSGQAYAFLALTPVKPGEEGPLKTYLEGLRKPGPSPFSRVPGTHMARFVIVERFFNAPSYKQRKPDKLDGPYLVFSSNFDGDLDPYLDTLCDAMASEAGEIWGRCVGCPKPAEGDALKTYLKHNQIKTGLFFSAYNTATVQRVRDALAQRQQMIDFAVRGQGLDAPDLQKAFLEEFS